MKPLLCIDYDGTIWDGEKPFPGCVEKLHLLRKTYTIGIYSSRGTDSERLQMKAQLDSYAIPYVAILGVKPNAVAFIDDKGWRFESWDKIPSTF